MVKDIRGSVLMHAAQRLSDVCCQLSCTTVLEAAGMIAESIAVTFTGANGIASVCKNRDSAKSSSISVDDAYATQRQGRKGARTLGLLSGCIAVGFDMVEQQPLQQQCEASYWWIKIAMFMSKSGHTSGENTFLFLFS